MPHRNLPFKDFSFRNIAALIFILTSLVFLYPGLTVDMFSIYVFAQLPILGEVSLYQETQSIVQTISSLFSNKNYFVAILILLFSIIVPLLKIVLLLLVLLFTQWKMRVLAYRFVSVIGKWSMADVFVVAVFLALLATRSNDNIEANLHNGFYYFTFYCIASIIGTQLLVIDLQPDTAKLSES